jgi:hypothetical protein
MAAEKAAMGFPAGNQAGYPSLSAPATTDDLTIRKTLATALLTTALMSGMAFAQTATNKVDTTTATSTMHKEGKWRVSKLVGVNVYNEANEKVGDINEVILEKSGKVANVILGVGGFLGMGEHGCLRRIEMGE